MTASKESTPYESAVGQLVGLMRDVAEPAIVANACSLVPDEGGPPGAPLGAALVPRNPNSCRLHIGLDDNRWPGDVFLVIGSESHGYEMWAPKAVARNRDAHDKHMAKVRRIIDGVISGSAEGFNPPEGVKSFRKDLR